MKPESLPVFLHAIPPISHYRAARAMRRRAMFWRAFSILCGLAVVCGGLFAASYN